VEITNQVILQFQCCKNQLFCNFFMTCWLLHHRRVKTRSNCWWRNLCSWIHVQNMATLLNPKSS
jgi:hypothetical protein